MKPREREEARKLRSEEGLSVGEIAKRLGVSKGTSSRWLKDIELTDEQRLKLSERGRVSIGQQKWAKKEKERAKEAREEYQKAGRNFAQSGRADLDYKILCALYWAEGNKDRWTVGMTNTDPDMLNIFVRGMRRYFGCKDADFAVSVMAHLGNGLTVEQIRDYWLKKLGLPEECFRRFTLKSKYYSTQNKKHNRHVYGGCSVCVHSTEIVQKLYGSIQEIFGIDRPEWLWG